MSEATDSGIGEIDEESQIARFFETDETKIILWDADNTLWNWIEMHLAGVKAQINTLAKTTGIPEDVLREAGKRVFEQAETFDYPAFPQNLEPLHDQLAEEAIEKYTKSDDKIEANLKANIVAIIRYAILRAIDLITASLEARENGKSQVFRLYYGIPSILEQTNDKGIRNIIISDAPISKIIGRLRQFDILKYFEAIHGRPDAMREEEKELGADLAVTHQVKTELGHYETGSVTVQTLPCSKKEIGAEGQPGLPDILGIDAEVLKKHAIFIDDNLGSGILVAMRHGLRAVLAGWGAATDEQIGQLALYGPPSVVSRNAGRLTHETQRTITKMGSRLLILDDPHQLDKPLGIKRKSSSRINLPSVES